MSIRLSPYASDHNPVEHVWNTAKGNIANIRGETPGEILGTFAPYVTGRAFDHDFEHLPSRETENDFVPGRPWCTWRCCMILVREATIMVAMIDRSPWELRALGAWERFCPIEVLGRIPKKVYGVFDRIEEPMLLEGHPGKLAIGNPGRHVYISGKDGRVLRGGVDGQEFINSDVDKFIRSLEVFAQAYPYYTDDTAIESICRKEEEIREALMDVDPVVSDDTDFWFGILEDFESYGEFSTEHLRSQYGVNAATD